MDTVYDRRVSSLYTTLILLIIIAIIFFAALLNDGSELAVLSIIIFGLTGSMKLWTHISRFKIRSSILIDRKRLFAGDQLSLMISVENGKFLPVGVQLDVTASRILHWFSGNAELKAEDTLLWNQRALFHWKLQAKARGAYSIGPLRMATGDLFGFFQKEIKNGESVQVIVYPRLVPLKPFSIPKRDFFGVPGGKHPVHDPVYILGTADYHYSRPAKYIHWKASARHCRLQEKIFDSTEQEKIFIILDVEQFAENKAAEAFEKTLEVAASMAVHLRRRGSAVGFAANGILTGAEASRIVPVSRTSAQLSSILEAMARLKMERCEPLIDFLRRTVRVPSGTTCVLFVYRSDAGTNSVMGHLKRRNAPALLYTYENILVLRGDSADVTPPVDEG
ncbi:MAG: DUF58 domain-containing protein [Spirochaetes bacterium]|nr:DUF58 domain-containing protein [Spirochaetota bacterium]